MTFLSGLELQYYTIKLFLFSLFVPLNPTEMSMCFLQGDTIPSCAYGIKSYKALYVLLWESKG